MTCKSLPSPWPYSARSRWVGLSFRRAIRNSPVFEITAWDM